MLTIKKKKDKPPSSGKKKSQKQIDEQVKARAVQSMNLKDVKEQRS